MYAERSAGGPARRRPSGVSNRSAGSHALPARAATAQKFKSIDQVNNLREIQALRRLMPHPNIVNLEEVLYDKPTGRLALVFELMSMNLYELIRGRKNHLNNQLIKIYCFQALRALDQMHSKGVFHRDIKVRRHRARWVAAHARHRHAPVPPRSPRTS